MGASRSMSIVASCFLAACGATVQPGLANAPGLNGTTPEMRVHDAVANGHDAYESQRTAATAPPPPTTEPPLQAPYPFELCPTRLQRPALATPKGLIAFPLAPLQMWPSCDSSESVVPTGDGELRLRL